LDLRGLRLGKRKGGEGREEGRDGGYREERGKKRERRKERGAPSLAR